MIPAITYHRARQDHWRKAMNRVLVVCAMLVAGITWGGCSSGGGGTDPRTGDIPGGDTTCTPSCIGKQCGDDGCGGSCGQCPAGQDCQSGVCYQGPSCTDFVKNQDESDVDSSAGSPWPMFGHDATLSGQYTDLDDNPPR